MKLAKLMQKIIISSLLFIFAISCKTTGKVEKQEDVEKIKESEFFQRKEGKEIFRVFVSSDHYIVKQYRYDTLIQRKEDQAGDEFSRENLKKLDKIDETRDGVVRVLLYPHSGSISRIRPEKLTFLSELDRLMVEDIQRWVFQFPKGVITPTRFSVRYRFQLRKNMKETRALSDVEKEYLKDNPEFLRYLKMKKRQMELQKKQNEEKKQ